MDPILEQSIENIFKLIEKNSLNKNQKEINNYLSEIVKTIDSRNSNFNKKFIDLGDKVNKLNSVESVILTDEIKTTARSNKLKKSLSNTLEKSKNIISNSADYTNSLYFSFLKANGSFESMLSPLRQISNLGLPLISGASAVIGAGAAILLNELDKYRNIGRAGIQVSEGLLGARQAAASLGLSFEQFSNNIFNYNSLIQKIGIPSFTSFFMQIRNGMSSFYELGLGSNELSEYAAIYLEISRQINEESLNDLSQRQTGFNKLLSDFYKTVQMTSGNIDNLMRGYLAQAKDPKTRLAFQVLPEQSRAALAAIREQFPFLGDILEESILTGNLAFSEQYGSLLQAGLVGPINQMLSRLASGTDFQGLIEPLRNAGIDYDSKAKFFLQTYVDDTGIILSEIGILLNKVNEFGAESISPVDSTAKQMIKTRELLKLEKDEAITTLLKQANDVFSVEYFSKITDTFKDLPNIVSNLISGGTQTITGIANSSEELNSLNETTKEVFLERGKLESSIVGGFDNLFLAAAAATATSGIINTFGNSIIGMINSAYSGINFGDIFDSYDKEINRLSKSKNVGKGKRAAKIRRARDAVSRKIPGRGIRQRVMDRISKVGPGSLVSRGARAVPLANLALSIGESAYRNYTQDSDQVQERLNTSREVDYSDVYELFLRDIASNFISNATLGLLDPNFDSSAQMAELLSRGYSLDEAQAAMGREESRGIAESILGTRINNLNNEIKNLENLRLKIERDKLIKEKQELYRNIENAIKKRTDLLRQEALIAGSKLNETRIYTDEFGNIIE